MRHNLGHSWQYLFQLQFCETFKGPAESLKIWVGLSKKTNLPSLSRMSYWVCILNSTACIITLYSFYLLEKYFYLLERACFSFVSKMAPISACFSTGLSNLFAHLL